VYPTQSYHRLSSSSHNLLYKPGKRQTLTPRAAQTHERISVNLEIYDYVRDATPRDKFGGSSFTWVVWANKQFARSPSLFIKVNGKGHYCYDKCKKKFFGYSKYYSVKVMLLALGLSSFDTVIHNYRKSLVYVWSKHSNDLVKLLQCVSQSAFL